MLSELQNYLHRIEDLRSQVEHLITGLDAAALNWRPLEKDAAGAIDGVNSLAVLAAHIAGAEHFWVAEVVGGQPATRKRTEEFSIQVESDEILLQLLQKTASETRTVTSCLKDEDLSQTRLVEGKTVSVRWGFLHVVDHTALHLGHMQLTYQLWHGGASKASPFWFQRLPEQDHRRNQVI